MVPILRPRIATVLDALRHGQSARPGSPAHEFQRRNAADFDRSLTDQEKFERGEMDNALGVIGHLWLAKVSGDERTDLGLVSCRVVTTSGVNYIVDAFQNLTELENMKYHAIGTGTGAESISNTSLGTELTSQYSTANTRVTGTLGEQSGNANVFESTATITVSAAVAITEHGIFSTPGSGSGVLLDRSVFAAVNLASGESLQATYSLTFPAGG